jgi:hypothetical protein
METLSYEDLRMSALKQAVEETKPRLEEIEEEEDYRRRPHPPPQMDITMDRHYRQLDFDTVKRAILFTIVIYVLVFFVVPSLQETTVMKSGLISLITSAILYIL